MPRTNVELGGDILVLVFPDGRWQSMPLHGCRFSISDASCSQRFVRQLDIENSRRLGDEHVTLITPPDVGAIAPRAARVPLSPKHAAVVEIAAWEAVVDWLRGGGRLGGRTLTELARLACIASPQFAVALGEYAAKMAVEMTWDQGGPMRASGSVRNMLLPLHEAARHSQRAADTLVAALAALAGMRGRARP